MFVLAVLAAALLLLLGYLAALMSFRSSTQMMLSNHAALDALRSDQIKILNAQLERAHKETELAAKIDRLLSSTTETSTVVEALDKNIGALIAIMNRAGHLRPQDAAVPMGPAGWGGRRPSTEMPAIPSEDSSHKKAGVRELAAGT